MKPERGQVSENGVHPPIKQPWCVLQDRIPWSYKAKDSFNLWPHPSFVVCNKLLSGPRYWLAWKSSRDEVNSPLLDISMREVSHVPVPSDGRPVLGQNSACIVIDLALPRAFPACPLKAEIYATNPREKRTKGGLHFPSPFATSDG